MYATETALVMLLAGFATAIALGAVEVPAPILHSSISQAFLLIMALVLFAYSPVVGIAAIAVFAIIMFKRNVQKTYQYSQVAQQFAKDAAASQEYQAMPYQAVQATQPRDYTQFKDQHPPAVPEGFVEGYASPEEVGTYPLGARPKAEATQSFTAMYRPAEDMGDNAFVRAGPEMDEKGQSFAY
jgi:hypothetical protein